MVRALAVLGLLSPTGTTTHGFDLAVRTITTAALAVGLVVAVIYESITSSAPDTTLVGWAGIVIGFYFGGHIATNGALVAETAQNVAVGRAETAAAASAESAKESAASSAS